AYKDRDHPQPVLAWADSPHEVRVAFDRPLDLSALRGVADGTSITFGQAVAPGDRFEVQRPGYATVADQLAAPRRRLRDHSASLTSDRRTLLLATERQDAAAYYAITLPGMGRPPRSSTAGSLGQEPTIDLGYDLGGVAASWQPTDGSGDWSG